MKTTYAIFRGNKRVTKSHSTREAAMQEAVDKKLTHFEHPDFFDFWEKGKKGKIVLNAGLTLERISS